MVRFSVHKSLLSACVVGVLALSFAGTSVAAPSYSPVGDNIFQFTNTISPSGEVLSGYLTGTGGNLTGFSGTFNGLAITGFTGNVSGYAGTYGGSSGAWTSSVPINFTIASSGGSYSFGSSSISGAAPNYTLDFGVTGPSFLEAQRYTVLSAPEIDGSVLPRSGFIVLGLVGLFLYHRRRNELAAA